MSPILFITADDEALERVTALLGARGLEVRHGGTGRDPLPPGDATPALVVLDTVLAGIDAATVVRRLDEAPDRPPVLVLGRREDAEATLAALAAGAEDAVLRPLDPWGLPARVEGLIARRRVDALGGQCRTLEFRNQELESFIYIVTHDMKTPVVNLQGLVGLIEQDHAGDLPPDVRDYLGRLRRNAERLEELLRDLLEYPRRLRILDAVEECDLADIVHEAVDGLAESAREADVEIVVADDLPTVPCDRRRLQQVFHNLVENAIKHVRGREERRVEIGWSRTSNGPIFHVRDTGPGVPAEHRDEIFRLFHRVPGTGCEGTGIGLAVARQLVEAHGGEIWCESEAGAGATFHFRLGH